MSESKRESTSTSVCVCVWSVHVCLLIFVILVRLLHSSLKKQHKFCQQSLVIQLYIDIFCCCKCRKKVTNLIGLCVYWHSDLTTCWVNWPLCPTIWSTSSCIALSAYCSWSKFLLKYALLFICSLDFQFCSHVTKERKARGNKTLHLPHSTLCKS